MAVGTRENGRVPLPPTITAWSTIPTVADELNILVTGVRQMIRDGKLLAFRDGEGDPLMIPSDFIQDRYIVKHLTGVFTLLRDAAMTDDEIAAWLTAEDETLPGTPLRALRENRGTEIKRRAQAEL